MQPIPYNDYFARIFYYVQITYALQDAETCTDVRTSMLTEVLLSSHHQYIHTRFSKRTVHPL